MTFRLSGSLSPGRWRALWGTHKNPVPPPTRRVTQRIRQELQFTRHHGSHVLLCTGNYRGLMQSLKGISRTSRGRWQVVSSTAPGDTLRTLTSEFGDETASFFEEVLVSGLPGPLAALVKATLKAGRGSLARSRRKRSLDGITPVFDDYWIYLEENAGRRPTILISDLSAPSATAFLRAFAAYLAATNELRDAPLLIAIGLDEASADALLKEMPDGTRAMKEDYGSHLSINALHLPPLRRASIKRWLGSMDDDVADLLITAAGAEDGVAGTLWSEWCRQGFVVRSNRRWTLTQNGTRELPRRLEGAIASFEPSSSAEIARSVLHASALFGTSFSGRAVVTAVSEFSSTSNAEVRAVLSQLSLQRRPLFVAVSEPTGKVDRHIHPTYRWQADLLREHALKDLKSRQGLKVEKRLALELCNALLLDPDEAHRHRDVVLRLFRIHPVAGQLEHLVRSLRRTDLDATVYWTWLLTLAQYERPSTELTIDLARACWKAASRGYLQVGTALALRSLASLPDVPLSDDQRWDLLISCGRALLRSGHNTEAAKALEQAEVLVAREAGGLDARSARLLGDLFHELGTNLRHQGNPTRALARLEQAYQYKSSAYREPSSASRSFAVTLYEIGVAKLSLHKREATYGAIVDVLGTLDRAIQLYRLGNEGRPLPGDLRDAGQCREVQADASYHSGDDEGSILYRREARQCLLEASKADPCPDNWDRTARVSRALAFAERRNRADASLVSSLLDEARRNFAAAYDADPSVDRRKDLERAVRECE